MSVDVYVYQAELCCDDCVTGIKEQLEKDYPSIAQRAAEGFVGSDDYPHGPHADGGGEADSPQHCSECGRFLGNPLTDEGERFVIETLGKYLQEGDEDLGNSFLANEVAGRISADDQIRDDLQDRYIEWSERYDYVLAAEAQRRKIMYLEAFLALDKVIEFKKDEVTEIGEDFEQEVTIKAGMRARIRGAEDSPDGLIAVQLDFSVFEDHNRALGATDALLASGVDNWPVEVLVWTNDLSNLFKTVEPDAGHDAEETPGPKMG